MAQKNRTKEIWLIPKRVNLHQTICLIDGIIERGYDGTSWTPQKQNNLGVNLKNWGATKDGKNISPQAIRTLVASIPQYLGFVFINTQTTPNTICLTEAGMTLWNKHKSELKKIHNLVEGKDFLINESSVVLKQMEKLQITNSIIRKDCENIYVFPFRFMLKVLLKIDYIDQEEIAYFLFKARREDEVDLIVNEIKNFRKLTVKDREELINSFKKTHIGNITLVKASSAGYFIALCQITGIIEKIKIKPNNKEKTISAIKIKNEDLDYVKNILDIKFKNIETYDFEDNLQLWIDYIGNENRYYPPIDATIKNESNNDYLVQIYKDNVCKYDDLICEKDVFEFPVFTNETYKAEIIDTSTGDRIDSINFTPTYENKTFEIKENSNRKFKNDTLEDIAKMINEHCESSNFSGKTLNYLNTLSKVTGIDKTTDKSLKGAYLEYYFYKMLSILKEENIIDDVIWNGRIGKYGLPVSAPGGKTGTPDLIFSIDKTHFVLELTTIKAKSLQFSAEGSSVPDHIRLYKEKINDNVIGIFSAPMIHERNKVAMESAIQRYNIPLYCVTTKKLVDLMMTKNREKIKSFNFEE